MDEGALASLRRPRSSAAIACQLVRRGQAEAVVSAGSTGGVVATARLRLRSLPGVMRPGLAVVLPTRPGPTVLVDAGAIADPKPEMLVAFAQLGVAYAQVACGIAEPRVGLLTIGAEPGKGNALTRRAHELLAAEPQGGGLPLYFAGNIEGGDLMAAAVDVIVTDGFTGNVALKTLEGGMRFVVNKVLEVMVASDEAKEAAKVLLPSLAPVADDLDPDTHGGAVLLGVNGVCVISHGSSSARAVVNAVRVGRDAVQAELVAKVAKAVARDVPR
jgi:glycerol-3-phosphate acyltransferase PlsX